MMPFVGPARTGPPLHIAGVGASAGGLEAMLPMFAAMPRTGRIAFVVAQHMAKDGHDELVARLIGRESALPVVLATQGTRLEADKVYVIPSGSNGRVEDNNALRLSPPDTAHLSTPSVNALFDSLAHSQRSRAIGIVLSGTGSDGTSGCRAIRASGGLTLAQEPGEAKFDGMPSAAIRAQTIDKVVSAGDMGRTLAGLFPGAALVPEVQSPAAPPPEHAAELEPLLRQVLEATGIDFSSYKEDTLLRRLEKRKSTLGIASAQAYQTHVRQHPDELKTLQHLFLVSVSSFFRDHESFNVLKMSLARLVAGKPAGEPVRIWVPGCASGEEPITLVILLKELNASRSVEVIATDLNPEALIMSREGVYRQTAFKEMDSALRDRYFLPKGQHFVAKQELLHCIRYEQRDVLSGAPSGTTAGGLDLVSCRNLLIYMKSDLQDKLIKSFHGALRPEGLLFIGQSESLNFVGNSLFSAIDHYHRLFRRRH